ncbi:hypothetical protein MNBD_GAMMA07-1170 [hydrothermal vent metagenome]|uniref:PilZ domain-containing protein n=1 Tax=hydrothermal vent metagenome TaxID=652676 RepID=A0A3B0WV61_9ZZZZ
MKSLAQRLFNRETEDHYVSAENTSVQVVFSSENPALLGKAMVTTAIEISPKSVRLEVSLPVKIDSVLDIIVAMSDSERSYNLTGNVRWRLPSSKGKYQIVLVLRERSDVRSDLHAWKSNFSKNFRD